MIDKTNFDKLVYLDSEFISAKYEEITEDSPVTEFTKTQGIQGRISLSIFSTGVHTQETRKFMISSLKMWKLISSELCRYPKLDIANFTNYEETKIGWISGNLSVSSWKKEGCQEEYEYFELYYGSLRVALLSEPEYFSAGFNKVISASSALKGNIGIPVTTLVRVLWYVENAKNYVACPYLILET